MHLFQSSSSIKCTLVQALRLCTGRTTHRGSTGIALPFHDHGTRRGWGVRVKPRTLFNPGKYPVPIVQEAVWAPGSACTGAENLALPGIRSPDHPARSQSQYWLRFPAHSSSIELSKYASHLLARKPLPPLNLSPKHCTIIKFLPTLNKSLLLQRKTT